MRCVPTFNIVHILAAFGHFHILDTYVIVVIAVAKTSGQTVERENGIL